MTQIVSPEKPALNRSIESLARELRQTNAQLEAAVAIEKNADTILKKMGELSKQLENQAVSRDELAKVLSENDVFGLFARFQSLVGKTKRAVSVAEENAIGQTVFLNNLRHHRLYLFSNSQKTVSFLRETAGLYSIPGFLFKPSVMGLADFSVLIKEKILTPKDKRSFEILPAHLDRVFSFLLEKKFATNFRFDSPQVRVLCKTPREIKIDAPNEVIKRLDWLATSMNAQLKDD